MSASAVSSYVAPQAAAAPLTWSRLTSGALQLAALIALAMQFTISPTLTNILAASMAFSSSTLTIQYLGRTRAYAAVPMSSFALLALCVITQWGALVAQSFEWTPVAENLREPLLTFGSLGVFQCAALLAHVIHRSFSPLMALRESAARGLARLGTFEIPPPVVLWVTGFVGYASIAIAGAPGDATVGTRFLDAFRPLAWTPFTIPILYLRFGPLYCRLRLNLIALAIYIVAAVALAIALNYRVLMIQGVTTVGLLAILVSLRSDKPFRYSTLILIVPLIALVAVAAKPVSDLATAMAIARADRGHVAPSELLLRTLDTLQDDKAIRQYREDRKADNRLEAYDETYFSNAVFARFVMTKFHDNTLYFGKDLTERERDDFEDDQVNRVWSILPYPLLRALKVSQDKSSLGHSAADYLVHLKTGAPLSGLKTGSLLAVCLVLFQEAGPAIYLAYCLFAYFVIDSVSELRTGEKLELSIFGMLMVYVFFTWGLYNDSLAPGLSVLIRDLAQSLAFYLLTVRSVRLLIPRIEG